MVALLARDAGDLPVAYQLLIYPATDMRCRHPSHAANGKGYLLETPTIAYYRGNYIDDVAAGSTGGPRRCCTTTCRSCRRRWC